jgi:RTX calcium-binding nonapeptide repeat (4 copies)
VNNTRRPRSLLLGAASLALCALLAPASASAVSVRQVVVDAKIAELNLEDRSGLRNVVALTVVTPSGGQPDLVIGDTAAGIPDPIPSLCDRVDPTIIRCPADEFGVSLVVRPVLGAGKDELTITLKLDAVLSDLTKVTANLGKGADRARDFSGFRDFWKGGAGPDQMFLGPGRDTAWGGAGADWIKGGQGRDLLLGQGQNDVLLGGGQADTIDCGAGTGDVGVGGPGRDLGKNCETVRH